MDVVGGACIRIYGNSHGTDFGGAEKRGYELSQIRKYDQDPVAARDSLSQEGISHAIRERRKLTMGGAAGFANDCQTVRVSPGRRIQKVLRNIEPLGGF
jgi:hypothetical protein